MMVFLLKFCIVAKLGFEVSWPPIGLILGSWGYYLESFKGSLNDLVPWGLTLF